VPRPPLGLHHGDPSRCTDRRRRRQEQVPL
jgi:hypothetical protein